MDTYTHETYLSPFTWRYGSMEMRRVWSELHRRRLWRRVWVALADAQRAAGLVTPDQVEDLRLHQDNIDLPRSSMIETQIQHDLMAEVQCFAEQCKVGGSIIHWGATSMDVEDNADALRLREALDLLLDRLRHVLLSIAEQVDRHADHVCMGFTHLQPAEPITVGYRLAGYGQDLLADWEDLVRVRGAVRGKGFRGAVGTSASYQELLDGTGTTAEQMQAHALALLGLEAFPITGQTYPRRQDWIALSALSGVGSTVYRLAFDLRILQAPLWGEWAEPFASAQVGSSAMPFKRNPIHSENVNSLARFLAALPRVAWDNAAHCLLERTLDDSANRRTVLPEAFLSADELLLRIGKVVSGLRVDDNAVKRNLKTYGIFSATERVLMSAVRAGADRQVLHGIIRQHSMAAWQAVSRGDPNPLADALSNDARITQWMAPARVRELLTADAYVGDAPERARRLAAAIREACGQG